LAEDTPTDYILLGAGIWSRPVYDGAITNHTVPIPVIRYYGKPWFARTTFGMLEGGARVELLRGFSIGTQLAYEGGRDSAESAYLTNHAISTIPISLSWGIHAELETKIGPMPLITLLRYRQDVDADRGAQADLRFTAGLYSNVGINAGIFVQSTWANTTSAQYYYGISAQQSTASGLPVYTMQSGQLFNSAGLLWSYDVDAQWMLLGSFEWRGLREEALVSPLVETSTGRYANLGIAYRF
jgi:outer membrane scaffolding protein for murein synthesis (MipA/OmpV family)